MDTRRQELAEFLQTLRQRSEPVAFGFPPGTRRRTSGLRREEVAQLAGISPTWYTWIEQGREVNVSADALTRIATALKLTHSERIYLFEIADRRDPHGAEMEEDVAPAALLDMIANLSIPAYLMGRYWDLLAWNPAASTLFSGWLDQLTAADQPPPNLLRYVFQSASTRQFVVNWESRARRLVAEFRADCRSRLDEPALQLLITELSQSSVEFERFWKQHDVLERQGGRREFNHPIRGLICYQQVTLRPLDQEQLKLVVLTPTLQDAN